MFPPNRGLLFFFPTNDLIYILSIAYLFAKLMPKISWPGKGTHEGCKTRPNNLRNPILALALNTAREHTVCLGHFLDWSPPKDVGEHPWMFVYHSHIPINSTTAASAASQQDPQTCLQPSQVNLGPVNHRQLCRTQKVAVYPGAFGTIQFHPSPLKHFPEFFTDKMQLLSLNPIPPPPLELRRWK